MKNLLAGLVLVLTVSACGPGPMDPVYMLNLPELPPAWQELLGSPRWRIEWVSPGGIRERTVTAGNREISLPQTWASAVTAWPFWPDRGIYAGTFRPAGAIFPFDASAGVLRLSWRGGVDAVLYRELEALPVDEAASRTELLRRPWNFNWPRFRQLWTDLSIPEEVRTDPWQVDWKQEAAKTVASGFNKRRLRPEDREEREIPAPPGLWIGVSPFAPPRFFGEDECPVFPVGSGTESWFSAAGTLRLNTAAWMLIPWQ